ncbi:MAG: AsmA-like C-terminal region-containing protein [Blastochloris sp.]|nr:AsmA-like C-terminal region-containing protein [Blastochloris sp.]
MPEPVTQLETVPRKKVVLPLRSFSLFRVFLTLVIVIIVALAALLFYFRYIGLPETLGVQLSHELTARGIVASYDRIYLTPLGGVGAKNLTVEQSIGGITKTLNIEDLRFGLNWISWWRGESFLESAQINNANLMIPLDGETAVRLRNVTARIDLKPQNVVVQNLEADLLNIHFRMRGTVDIKNYQPKDGASPIDMSRYAELWKKIETASGEVDGARMIRMDADFDLVLAKPETSHIRLRLSGERQTWRGVVLEAFYFDGEYLDQRVAINGEVNFLRGGFQLEANWRTDQKKAVVTFYSDVDLSLLSSALPEQAQAWIADVRFRSLPVNEGTVELDWEHGLKYVLQSRSIWKNFSIQGTYFDSLYCPISYDGKRMMVTEMVVINPSGRSTFSAFYDGEKSLKAKLRSTIDPSSVKKLFGEKAQPFFNSLKFNDAPLIDCTVIGEGFKMDTMEIQGTVSATDFSYKNVPLQEMRTSFNFKAGELHLPDLYIKRTEGEGRGEIWHNMVTKQVRMKGVKGKLMIGEVATIIGDKMSEYAKPYGFYQATEFEVDGQVDLDKQIKTDLKARVKSDKGLDYVFLGKKLSLKKLDADISIKGIELKFKPRKPIEIFNGELEGNITVQLTSDPSYQAILKLRDQEFGPLVKTFFNNDEISGKISGTVDVNGRFSDLASMQGWGDFVVVKGFLYNIPMFGGFSAMLNSIVPNLGYSEASQARTSFTVRDGLITIQKVDVYSTAFALIGNGSYDMIKDDVNMNMRVNLRGVLGIPMFFVSKLFEYEGKGTLSNTIWGPKVF